MNTQTITKGKAYYHDVIIKTAYLYLPIFAVIILVCSFFEKFRFILYFTVVGASYGFILNQLKKKYVNVEFDSENILLGEIIINTKDIESYYLSLPLNELLMLRIKTKNQKDLAVYIDKDLKMTIESFFNRNSIESVKENYDNYLKYGHLIFPFVGLIICAIVYSIYNYFKYKV
ncbi:hypothetical protein OMO38_19820 [Chryseobacterium sp. 09-1422]|jgi:hypothetical protein|uniref:Uncharacterized protein n=1 Tax=Chryseobacterium kimseyorum TaxID=2984028 RepID=A0ABT3I489_9FLAO|nr:MULTISPECIES: hypothetical protein [Chryseobacterium]MCW3170784.1 hypothetical protein [Chryseobacterium kimseyorum]REC39873.1 hypothetical protein DRF69_21195 [Chryseobacterium sp. 5_R23647]